jgi:hypothetical protein
MSISFLRPPKKIHFDKTLDPELRYLILIDLFVEKYYYAKRKTNTLPSFMELLSRLLKISFLYHIDIKKIIRTFSKHFSSNPDGYIDAVYFFSELDTHWLWGMRNKIRSELNPDTIKQLEFVYEIPAFTLILPFYEYPWPYVLDLDRFILSSLPTEGFSRAFSPHLRNIVLTKMGWSIYSAIKYETQARKQIRNTGNYLVDSSGPLGINFQKLITNDTFQVKQGEASYISYKDVYGLSSSYYHPEEDSIYFNKPVGGLIINLISKNYQSIQKLKPYSRVTKNIRRIKALAERNHQQWLDLRKTIIINHEYGHQICHNAFDEFAKIQNVDQNGLSQLFDSAPNVALSPESQLFVASNWKVLSSNYAINCLLKSFPIVDQKNLVIHLYLIKNSKDGIHGEILADYYSYERSVAIFTKELVDQFFFSTYSDRYQNKKTQSKYSFRRFRDMYKFFKFYFDEINRIDVNVDIERFEQEVYQKAIGTVK